MQPVAPVIAIAVGQLLIWMALNYTWNDGMWRKTSGKKEAFTSWFERRAAFIMLASRNGVTPMLHILPRRQPEMFIQLQQWPGEAFTRVHGPVARSLCHHTKINDWWWNSATPLQCDAPVPCCILKTTQGPWLRLDSLLLALASHVDFPPTFLHRIKWEETKPQSNHDGIPQICEARHFTISRSLSWKLVTGIGSHVSRLKSEWTVCMYGVWAFYARWWDLEKEQKR